MNEQAKEARKAYNKAWREKNKERLKANAAIWREKNREKIREYNKRYWERKGGIQQDGDNK